MVGKTNRFSARSHLLPSGFSHSFSGLFSWSGWFDAVDLGRKDILPGRCGLRIRATFEEANAVGNCLCRIRDVMRSELEQSVCSFRLTLWCVSRTLVGGAGGVRAGAL